MSKYFQDPVDLAHITYEYDHSLLEHEEGGTEARRLTQRACIMTLTLGDQQVRQLLMDLADTDMQVMFADVVHSVGDVSIFGAGMGDLQFFIAFPNHYDSN